MTPNAKDLAESWIQYLSGQLRSAKFSRTDDGNAVLNSLVREDPEVAWNVILEILRSVEPARDNPVFAALASGPLQDLLSNHGSLVIERVETLARRDPAFNLLLGGVWQGGMSTEIWGRVEKCRLNKW
jgi:hypothetical protein